VTVTDSDIDELLTLAVDVARQAADVHRAGLARPHVYESKSSPTDLVGDVDRDAERTIVESIRRVRPDDAMLAEESADHPGSTGVRWVVDPLDGTVNYSRRYPVFAVSIGIEIEGVPTVGVVLDTARDRLFVGVRGRGSTRDGAPIRVAERAELSTALVATGFSYQPKRRAIQADVLRAVLPRIGDIRRGGSAALDLCAVACGEVDAYFETDVSPWDMAGGRVIAVAAGAFVLIVDSGDKTVAVAASPSVADVLLNLLRSAGVH
jgi:myo-inositol-1(or 4)-monophosphatase